MIWPFTWKRQIEELKAAKATLVIKLVEKGNEVSELLEKNRNYRAHVEELSEQLYRHGAKASANFPIHDMYATGINLTKSKHDEIHTIKVKLEPLHYHYALPFRHLELSEASVRGFIQHLSGRLGHVFSEKLTEEFERQGALKKV